MTRSPTASHTAPLSQLTRATAHAMLVVAFVTACSASGSPLRDDETVVIFPALGWRADALSPWRVDISGWVFEEESDDALRSAAIAAAREALGLTPDADDARLFGERVSRFLVDNERGKVLTLRIGEEEWLTPPTDPDGHFELTVELPAELSGPQVVEVAIAGVETVRASAVVHLIDPEGLTVVSDIDDTVKVSNVLDRTALLRATFLEPFAAVPGMAERYREWLGGGGVHLHFVSSSPWQLFSPLTGFLAAEAFPSATFTLRRIRLKDMSALDLLADPFETKVAAIESILERFPRRRFVLVGDSGEKDPEVYGELARRHPERVAAIFVRDVTGEALSSPRYTAAFSGVPPERGVVFSDASELPLRSQLLR